VGKRLSFICCALLIVSALISWAHKRLDAPAWTVVVTDSRGRPVSGVPVDEVWKNYACEAEGHTVTLVTGNQGTVNFPARYVRHNPFGCASETLLEAMAFVHGSFGPDARVEVPGLICVPDEKGNCIDWTGTPQSVITHVSLQRP
jgi:hypothetical protein